jgi:hypothetical protein
MSVVVIANQQTQVVEANDETVVVVEQLNTSVVTVTTFVVVTGIDVVENLGDGAEVFKETVDKTAYLRSLTGSGTAEVTEEDDTINIHVPATDLTGYATLTDGKLTQAENPQPLFVKRRYVSRSAVVAGDRDGSIDYPFNTVQEAFDYFGEPVDLTDFSTICEIVVLDKQSYPEVTITAYTRRYYLDLDGGATISGNWTWNIDNALRFGSGASPTIEIYANSRGAGTTISGSFTAVLDGTPVSNLAERLTNILWVGNWLIPDGTNGGSSVTTAAASSLSLTSSTIVGTFLGRNVGIGMADQSAITGNVEIQAILATSVGLLTGTSIKMYGTSTTTRDIFGLQLAASVAWENVNVSPRWLVDDYTRGQLDSRATITTNQFTFTNPVAFVRPYRAITALRTLDGTDYVVNVTANSFTVTLPTAVGVTGRVYIIKNSGAGTTTIATTSAQTIDGSAPGTLTTGQMLRVQSTGAGWITV